MRHQFRVMAWCKPLAIPGANPAPLYGWEPVILRGGRRDPGLRYPRDWLVCTQELYTFRQKPEGHVTGAKPPGFCKWLFACLGCVPGDELVDLFPGSGAVAEAWEAFSQQLPLEAPPPATPEPEALPGL